MKEPLMSAMPEQTDEQKRFKSRLQLILMVVVFAAPVLISIILFNYVQWRPHGNLNYGELVQPPIALDMPDLVDYKSNVHESVFWEKWNFVIIYNGTCEQACRKSIYDIRQIRTALGKHMDRAQIALLLPQQQVDVNLQTFLKDYPMLTVFDASEPRVSEFVQQFKLADKAAPGTDAVIYMLDPYRNLMMYYTENSEAGKILKDLRRLLRVSPK